MYKTNNNKTNSRLYPLSKDEGLYATNRKINNYTINVYCKLILNEDYCILKVLEDKLTIELPTIDYKGKLMKLTKKHNGLGKIITVYSNNNLLGKFTKDIDESTEDKLVFYFE